MLSVRPPVTTLPSYSLTGDLLGFLRCGLQYRYTRISGLPSSHPVQLWFGRFIHAVLEESYRTTKEKRKGLPPWSQPELDDIFDRIDRILAAQNIVCWDTDSEKLGRLRATAAVNEMGPILFPLINQAEVRVRGARKLPLKPPGGAPRRDMERYEMQGVIDVVTQVELFSPRLRGDQLLELIVKELPKRPPDEFEVIVDYKGMSRPAVSKKGEKELWEIYEWQVHTYAHLRSLLTTKPIIAGVLIYLNELVPTKSDFAELQQALRKKDPSEVLPMPGTKDEKVLSSWKPSPKEEPPLLSLDYRLTRALRVVPITQESIDRSLAQFDQVVGRIEKCLIDEASNGKVIPSWERNSAHEPTCKACDSRTYCPDFTKENEPRLPGYKI